MLRFLPWLAALVVAVYSVVDCIQTPEDRVRGLPKVVWVFVILLFPYAGSAAWWFAGRPKAMTLPGRPPSSRGRSRPIGPDDDPDFLRKL
ncbi:MAG: PLDc_N domain-containing protein [Tetrasphaera sp.]|jgi:hypothetical protein|nr:PLDc_N domain-containing protein [Tetrasphaera sp.]